MAIIEIKVPDIGDFAEVTVIELLVKAGDTITAEQSLITVESDKASMEIPSSHAGVVKELKVALGDKVKEGSSVLMLEVADVAGAAAVAPASVARPATPASASTSNQAVGPVQQVSGATNSVVNQGSAGASSALADGAVPAVGLVELRVPDIGDFKDVTVIEVMVKVGDRVRLEQSLITVESDKASMEIPSSAAGVIKELKVKLGDKVNIGDLLAILEGTVVLNPPALGQGREAAAGATTVPPPQPIPAHSPAAAPQGLPHASPSVRKFARELGVPLTEVKGSGLKGRITDVDVQSFTRSVMSGAVQTLAIAAQQAAKPAAAASDGAGLGLIPWPKVDFSKFGPIERKELSRIKKIGAANLLRNAVLIPAVTNHDDCDITDLEAFRVATNLENEKSGTAGDHAGVKVTMLAFLIKALSLIHI